MIIYNCQPSPPLQRSYTRTIFSIHGRNIINCIMWCEKCKGSRLRTVYSTDFCLVNIVICMVSQIVITRIRVKTRNREMLIRLLINSCIFFLFGVEHCRIYAFVKRKCLQRSSKCTCTLYMSVQLLFYSILDTKKTSFAIS